MESRMEDEAVILTDFSSETAKQKEQSAIHKLRVIAIAAMALADVWVLRAIAVKMRGH
jgi:hypothetical protein